MDDTHTSHLNKLSNTYKSNTNVNIYYYRYILINTELIIIRSISKWGVLGF